MKTSRLKKTLLLIASQCLIFNLTFSQGVSLPYTTGFDNAAQKVGWQQFRTGYLSSYSWSYGGGGFSAPSCISHDYNVGGNSSQTVIDWFVSPALNFTSTGKISLKVKTSGFSTPFPDNCEIWFGTDIKNPATGNFVLVANLSYMQPQYQWLDTTINLPYVTDSGYVAFKYKTIGAAWMTYAIDNITINLDASVSINETGNSNITLLKIYPNPFNSSATIQFNSNLENAELNFYTIYGQKIKTVNNISGDQIKIDRENLSSGIYFYELMQNGKTYPIEKLLITD
jgi:hypothetical protein